ncbi:uncharacterized protein PHACADRAFT_93624, partial [Phanerochaete carnosa HHB-10118-sp]
VGAGPSGLVLALSLLKNGVSVRIIEKDAEHHRGERGPGIMVCNTLLCTRLRSLIVVSLVRLRSSTSSASPTTSRRWQRPR